MIAHVAPRLRRAALLVVLLFVISSPSSLHAQTSDINDAGVPDADATDEPAPPAAQPPVGEAVPPAATTADNDAALAALMASTPAIEADEASLNVYGFTDFGVQRYYVDGPIKDLTGTSPFFIGNVNMYLAANLTHGFSSLVEVRFTYMPGGTQDPPVTGRTITTYASDPATFGRAERWGGIVMQRVHLDYSYHSLLNVRVGQFLTPYGIWNVDHGSPTIIGINRPFPIGMQFFPERQIGLQLFGTYLIKNTTLGYHLTLSNGRSDFENLDYDKNRALGGRLFVATDVIGAFKFGLSAYGGRATFDASYAFTFMNGQPGFKLVSNNQYDEFALAADVLWEWKGLRVQAEAFMSQQRYTARGRRISKDMTGAAVGYVPDNVSWSWYGLVGYRLPWYPVMPFFIFEQIRHPLGNELPGNFSTDSIAKAYNIGLNIRPIPSVAIKGQYIRVLSAHSADANIVGGQVAWAF